MSSNDNRSIYQDLVKVLRKNRHIKDTFEYFLFLFYKVFLSQCKFTYRGKKYKYFYHRYNATFTNERSIEIPISKELIDKYRGKDILEVGNVLNRYIHFDHIVLDKHEIYPGVVNEDVVNYKTDKLFDLIISVSTLEHVGFSMGEKLEPGKFKKSVSNLIKLLKKDGLFFVTLPMFYNAEIDRLLSRNEMVFQEEYFMKRTSALNHWVQIDKKQALVGPHYNSKYIWGNLIYFGYYYN